LISLAPTLTHHSSGTPAPLRLLLRTPGDHRLRTRLVLVQNGELLTAAEAKGFEVFVTTDMNLRYQQNLASRTIAIVVLSTTSWPRIERAAELVAAAIDSAGPGTYAEVPIP
jgi:hypothetical protein